MAEELEHPGKPVADPETYRDALERWMRRHRPDAEALRVHDVDMPRATGFSNETVFFDASWNERGEGVTRRYVARIEPVSGGLFPVQTSACTVSVELQHRIMQTVAEHGVRVPPTLPFEADASVLGRPFFVMEFVPGVIPTDVPPYSQAGFLVESSTPAQRARLNREGIEVVASVAAIDWRAAGLDWLDPSGDGKPEMSHQLALYRACAEQALAGREHPVLQRSLDWLDATVPSAPTGLTWGDARIANIIWQDHRAAAVLDWEAAALAPPEADIGWWVMFDRMVFDDADVQRLPGFPTREEMVAQWEELTGRSVAPTIDYWEIFAVMRFCAIFIGLGDRMTDAGLMPVEQSMAVNNHVTTALDRLLARQGA